MKFSLMAAYAATFMSSTIANPVEAQSKPEVYAPKATWISGRYEDVCYLLRGADSQKQIGLTSDGLRLYWMFLDPKLPKVATDSGWRLTGSFEVGAKSYLGLGRGSNEMPPGLVKDSGDRTVTFEVAFNDVKGFVGATHVSLTEAPRSLDSSRAPYKGSFVFALPHRELKVFNTCLSELRP